MSLVRHKPGCSCPQDFLNWNLASGSMSPGICANDATQAKLQQWRAEFVHLHPLGQAGRQERAFTRLVGWSNWSLSIEPYRSTPGDSHQERAYRNRPKKTDGSSRQAGFTPNSTEARAGPSKCKCTKSAAPEKHAQAPCDSMRARVQRAPASHTKPSLANSSRHLSPQAEKAGSFS